MGKNWRHKIAKTKETVEKIQRGEIEFFRTGFEVIDEVLYGSVLPGAQFVVGGATGMGKTMVMINMALRLAQMGKRVRYFSLENSVHSIIVRMVANISGIYTEDIRRGDLSEAQLLILNQAYEVLEQLDIDVYDDIFNVNEICKKIENEKPNVFFIDYVQNLYLDDYVANRSRTQEVGKISGLLRETAVKNEAISVLGSQLSRKVETRDDKRPRNSDLRDSGELEQDADVIMLLYRDEYYNRNTDKPGILEILISKNREGRTGVTELRWQPEFSRITDIDDDHGQHFSIEEAAKETIEEYIDDNMTLSEAVDF